MDKLKITAGSFTFGAKFETAAAPKTVAKFRSLLPYVENHFITITDGLENLAALGKTVLWQGAQPIRFELA